MKKYISIALLALFYFLSATAQQDDYPQLKAEAEKFYAAGSYARANDVYSKVNKTNLPAAEVRWVAFRLADTNWRAQAATETSDTTKFEQAQKQLEELIRVVEREDERDLVWAEAQESLGDFFWTRRNQMNWGLAWPHYQPALDWWAGQRDLDRARERYLRIVFKAALPPRADDYYYYTYYGNYIPIDILENALKISVTETDRVRLHFLIAMTLRATAGDFESRQRVPEEFEAALHAGKKAEWYDDALFHYAEWMNSNGSIRQLADGQWQQEADYVMALELYRRLTREFVKGETRYYDQAQQQIKNITEPSLSVGVSNIFLPDSELQFGLNARNVRRVDFALYRIDLTRDVRFTKNLEEDEGEGSAESWLPKVPLAGRVAVKTWSKTLDEKLSHKPFGEEVRVEGKLPIGAYLLEARSGPLSARDLVLITDVSIVLKSSAKQALVYFCNAVTGEPIPNANVTLWETFYENEKWHSRRMLQTTNSEGLAPFLLKGRSGYSNLFAAAGSGANAGLNNRQAFSAGTANGQNSEAQPWRIYAFTDRPAYRPKETVQWKFIARRLAGGVYSTPANQIVEYQINDPRGTKVSEGKATLNSFGSAWATLDLGEQLPLGEYNIQFWDDGRNTSIGSAKLFRLEEYKLPEFKVSVKTPEQDGRKKSFRLGEKVEVNIQADYYFGGPVSNASVEVVVYQNPFYHYWFPRHDYPWYYQDIEQQGRYYYGQGPVIKREIIKTDATGKASLTFDTPRENYNQDFEYRIEARVTDSSRREIVSSNNVRVTRQRYYVYPRPQQNIYRPKDKVTVDIKALDANEQPVTTEGQVKVTRDYWWEIWLDPNGREVKGEELRLLQTKPAAFPPLPAKGQKPWRLKFRGYQHDDILTQTVKTDAEGAAQLSFTPEREGYYRVAWQSSQSVAGTPTNTKRERFLPPIKAETYVFVATNASTELGYRHGGVEIIADKDTFRAGQVAPVMLFVPASDRYVLFSVEAEDLFSYRLVHVTGTAKLLELPIEEKHVPNIFLSAAMVHDAELSVDNKQIVVPPVQQFLAVDVKSDREQYQPQEEGTLAITTRDADGKPVSAEVALGLIDESVKYIQQDYAGDPRQFYYGTKRSQLVQTQSTFNQKSYTKLVLLEKGQLVDVKEVGQREDDEERARFGAEYGRASGTAGVMADSVSSKSVMRSEMGALANRAGAGLKKDGLDLSVAAPAESIAPPPPPAPGQQPAVQVRSDFRSTIIWQPDVKTDTNGMAIVKVKYPDSLTTWQATARVVTTGNQFGIGNTATRTKQPLIIRLQAPRFFVVGDQVTVSGVINNNTDQPMRVSSSLTAEGLTVSSIVIDGKPVKGEAGRKPERERGLFEAAAIEVKAGEEARVDWLVSVPEARAARLKVEARALDGNSKYADAMEKTFTVYEHGIEKFVSRSGKMRGESVTINLNIPQARRPETTELTVQVAPSLAVTMLDALPYLIDYPYGCTEQTMSRFLPAVITAKTLRDLGLKPEAAMHKVFGGIEPATAAATHPKGARDLKELDRITKEGLERLYNFQHSDGGWGWWKEGDSDHFMTAYVLWGLALARQAGIEVKPDVATRAASYLDKELVEAENSLDQQAWMLHALAVHSAGSAGVSPASSGSSATKFQAKAFDNLWANRDKLNAYTRSLLALAAHNFGYHDKAKTLIENLENGVKIDSKPDTSIVQPQGPGSDPLVMATAHWGEDGLYWHWSDGGVEATSFALRALLAIDPQNRLVEPVTNWLIKNRRGAQWSNTRDTAIVVLTLNNYLRASKELQGGLSYELAVNGNVVATKQVSAEEALGAPSKFEVSREFIKDGANQVSIRRTSGNGPIYFAAEAKFFSLEEPVTPAGNEIFVRRQYFKLVNHPTLLKGFVSERVPLNDGDTVKSGERVETVITIEAKNNYEYLLFEDLKPGGLEAVQLRSGENTFARELKSGAIIRTGSGSDRGPGAGVSPTSAQSKSTLMNYTSASDFTGRTRWIYQELRDRKVALFIDHLPQGIWQVSYEMRAESPGAFHALPVLGHAMYVPEIRTNGTEVRIRVVD